MDAAAIGHKISYTICILISLVLACTIFREAYPSEQDLRDCRMALLLVELDDKYPFNHHQYIGRLQSKLISQETDETWNTCIYHYGDRLDRYFSIDDDPYPFRERYELVDDNAEQPDYMTCFWYVAERVAERKDLERAISFRDKSFRMREEDETWRDKVCPCFYRNDNGTFSCKIVVKGYMKSFEHLGEAVGELKDWFTLIWMADEKNDGDGPESSKPEKLDESVACERKEAESKEI